MTGPITTALAAKAAYVVVSSKLAPGCTLPGFRAVASYRQASVAAGPGASGDEPCTSGIMNQCRGLFAGALVVFASVDCRNLWTISSDSSGASSTTQWPTLARRCTSACGQD